MKAGINIEKIKHKVFAPFFKKESVEEKLKFIRDNIILSKDSMYFDWGATGLCFKAIEKRIEVLASFYANTHSKFSTHSMLMEEIYFLSKEILRGILGIKSDFSLLCNFPNSTLAIKKMQEILGVYIPPALRDRLKPDHLGVCINGGYEHHSNEISWRESLLKSTRVDLAKDGKFSIENVKPVIDSVANFGDIKVASFSMASNVTGVVTPYAELTALLRKHGFIVMYDMSASCSHMKVDSKHYDVAVLSGHKLLGGPSSSSILVFRNSLYKTEFAPTCAGGGTIKYANSYFHRYHSDIERREEAGSIDILGLVKVALCYKLLDEVGFDYIKHRERSLKEVLLYELEKIPAVDIYGPKTRDSLFSIAMNAHGVSPYDLSHVLSTKFGIQTRAGCSCAGPYGHELLGIEPKEPTDREDMPGWLRLTPHFSSSVREMNTLSSAISKSVSMLRGG